MRRPLCFICLCFAAWIAAVLVFSDLQGKREQPTVKEDNCEFTGRVSRIERQDGKAIVSLKGAESSRLCYFSDFSQTKELRIGSRATVRGTFRAYCPAANEGQFDALQYYAAFRMDGFMTGCRAVAVSDRYNPFDQWLYECRQRLSAVLDGGLSQKAAGVMKAMLLGEKKELDGEVRTLYQRNGIAHVLAISGLHITTLGMGLYRLLRKLRLPAGAGAAGALLCILGYGRLTGFGASTFRSVVMFALFLFSSRCKRTYDLLTALAVSGALLLLRAPYLVRQSGFLLSFGAVMGIALLSPGLSRLLFPRQQSGAPIRQERKRDRIVARGKRALCASLTTSLSVTLATLPVQLWFFFVFPPYGIFLNIVIVPLLSLLLCLGIAGMLLGVLFEGAALWCLRPCAWILGLYEGLCRAADALPGSSLCPGRPAVWQIAVYYAVLAAVMIAGERKGRSKRAYLAAALLSGTLLLCVRVRVDTSLTMLDVGQGDCFVIEEKGGMTMMIDGGSTDVSEVGKYRIAPYLKSRGITRIDYVFLSHGDKDHICGIEELLADEWQDITIKNLVFTKFAQTDEGYRKVAEAAQKRGVRILYIAAGDRFELGGVTLTCLYPHADTVAEGNDQSMVLDMECNGIKTLFTGDLTEAAEPLVDCGDVNLLKVGHHGSRYSSSEAFLLKARPETALISAGRDNRYGHPHADTMERLEALPSAVFVTSRRGAVRVRFGKGKYRVISYR